ncbi:MAG TPA: acyl-CoA dehydrogenase N-terminal domain-containing protein, partial [Novosphingobium sp.]|nr:acyl-CoA dehydrogenase N-terminal domain-containing protein [Novosphingobium sp.]
MPVYKAPTRDTRFILNEVLRLESLSHLEGFGAISTDVVDAIVEEGGRFTSEVLAPINMSGD